MNTNSYNILKQTEVPNYNPAHYSCQRLYATARDGTKIPISLVHHKKVSISGDVSNPLILYGYGSYGASIDPSFDFKRIPLLDRGVVYCIAHIRGGKIINIIIIIIIIIIRWRDGKSCVV